MPLVQNHLFAGVLLGSFWEELPIPEEKDPGFFFFLSGFYQYRINSAFQEAGGSPSRTLTSTLNIHFDVLQILETDRTSIIFQHLFYRQ